MANPFFTKAIFSWNVPAVEGGNQDKFADKLKAAGFEAVYLKMADGTAVFKPSIWSYPTWGENVKRELVDALRARGIKVIGWQFNYGSNVLGEAIVAAQQSLRFQVDGWIFDIESTFERNTAATANAYGLINEYKRRCPNTPIAFCSWAQWRSPTTGTLWHNENMAKAFMEKCDVGMPMLYWGDNTSPVWLLNESLKLWRNFTTKPIIPVGRAYTGDGGTIDAGDISAFAAEVHNKHLPGLSWWVLDHAVKTPAAWSALAAIPGFAPVPAPEPPPPPPPPEPPADPVTDAEKLNRLWNAHPELHNKTTYLPLINK